MPAIAIRTIYESHQHEILLDYMCHPRDGHVSLRIARE